MQTIETLLNKLETSIYTEILREIQGANDIEKIAMMMKQLPNSKEIDDITRDLIRLMPEFTQKEMASAIVETMNEERKFLDEAHELGLIDAPLENKYFNYIVAEQAKKTASIFNPYLRKIPNAYKNMLADELDFAYVQMASGVFSREQVTTNLVNHLIKQNFLIDGRSPSAFVREKLISARNAAIQESKQVQMDELNVDEVITTAHNGARPKHAEWQGQIIKRKDLKNRTGLGKVDGLLGINCRHNYHAYFADLDTYDVLNVSRETSDKRYEIEQEMRYIERQARKWTLKQTLEKQANVENAKTNAKVKEWKSRAKEHAKTHDLYLRKGKLI